MPNDTNLNNPIVFEHVEKYYDAPEHPVLKDVSFAIAQGEFVCFIGPSGAGKSTILKIMAGLEHESAGLVKRPDNIGMVFQSGALFPWLTVFDNVALGLRVANTLQHTLREVCLKYIAMMGLTDFVAKYPHELSGGQRQRVGIARALAIDPAVLLLDEPFSALDIQTSEELHKDIINTWRQTKKTIVMVSHSIEEALTLADRIILMHNASITQTFEVTLKRPRREQGVAFHREVMRIRKAFFQNV